MLFLRYMYIFTLAVWLGGMIILGALAAPATFDTLQARNPSGGRVAAGAVFGEMLKRFHRVSYVAGVIMIASLIGMAALGQRPTDFGVRLGLLSIMLLLSLGSGMVVAERVEKLQQATAGPISALPSDDPRRQQFGRLHGLSNLLMMLNVAGGLALVYWEAKG